MNDSIGRILRSLLQLVAAGVLYEVGIIELVAADLNSPYIIPLYYLLVMAAQNITEELWGHAVLRENPKPAPSPLHEDDPHTFT